MPKKYASIVLIMFGTFFGDKSSAQNSIDISAIDPFWKAVDIWEQGQTPDESLLDQLFNHAMYIQLEKQAQRTRFIKKILPVVFMPGREKECDSLIQTKGLNPNYARITRHFKQVKANREKLEAYLDNLQIHLLQERFIASAQVYLPEGITIRIPPPKVQIGFFEANAFGGPQLTLDLLYLMEKSEEENINLLAHEAHHYYVSKVNLLRESVETENPDQDTIYLFYALNSLMEEGIASMLDKFVYLDPEYRRRVASRGKEVAEINEFVNFFQDSPKYIARLDSFLLLIESGKMPIGKAGKAMKALLPWGGHPTGMYMAQTIQSRFGRNRLVSTCGNAFAFLLEYQLAARKDNGPLFSKRSISWLKQMEERFLAKQKEQAQNPAIFADVPDMSMIRVGNQYYMSSTTMHMSPGAPIMKSTDLVNWKIIGYAYDTLANIDALNLANGKNAYGRGSWASCLRYHKGLFYVSTFAQTTGKTHIYSTSDIEKGPWKAISFEPAYHDHSIFFDDDGKVYMIYGNGKLHLAELNADLSGVKPGTDRVLIENASAPAGNDIGLGAEGSQVFKVNGKYYLLNIVWPKGGMRTVIIHRADKITGPWESKLAFQDLGIAQGGLIDTPDGRWFAYLFRDYGGVGRIPYLLPVTWENGWPVLGENGKSPETLHLPANKSLIPGVVASDEFRRKKGSPALPLVWQWNHNPDHSFWTLTERKGFLRLKTGRIDTSFVSARNTLTQRTIGPENSGATAVDVAQLKDGDFAGLGLLQKHYGLVGIKAEKGKKYLVMVSAASGKPLEMERVPLSQNRVYLRADCDFKDLRDMARFYYSLDGKNWRVIGESLKMPYTLPHFMGYRFGLFNFATLSPGGYADFDWFRINDQITK